MLLESDAQFRRSTPRHWGTGFLIEAPETQSRFVAHRAWLERDAYLDPPVRLWNLRDELETWTAFPPGSPSEHLTIGGLASAGMDPPWASVLLLRITATAPSELPAEVLVPRLTPPRVGEPLWLVGVNRETHDQVVAASELTELDGATFRIRNPDRRASVEFTLVLDADGRAVGMLTHSHREITGPRSTYGQLLLPFLDLPPLLDGRLARIPELEPEFDSVAFGVEGNCVLFSRYWPSAGAYHLVQRQAIETEGLATWSAAAFSVDGSLLAGGVRGGIELRAVPGYEFLSAHGGLPWPPTELAWHPDGRSVFAASNRSPGLFRVTLGDAEPVQLARTLTTCLAVSPLGDRLAVGGPEGQVLLLDPDGIDDARRLSVSDAPISSLAFSPDGTWLAVGDEAGVVAWRLDEKAPRWSRSSGSGEVLCLDVSPCGGLLATGAGFDDAYVRVFELETGRELARSYHHDASVCAVRFSADGSELVSLSEAGELGRWTLPTLVDSPTPVQAR